MASPGVAVRRCHDIERIVSRMVSFFAKGFISHVSWGRI